MVAVFLLGLSQNIFAQTEGKKVYPLVISFHSMCCGVPSDSAIQKFISSFKKKYKVKKISANSIGPLGREGEYELVFNLKELNKKQQSYFISKIKKVGKFPSDKGSFSFEENKEIDLSAIPKRAGASEVVF